VALHRKHAVTLPGSHTPSPHLPFPPEDIPNAHLPTQNHHNQPDEADQAANVENVRYHAELSPSGYLGYTSLPKYLKLIAARFAFFIIKLYCMDSE